MREQIDSHEFWSLVKSEIYKISFKSILNWDHLPFTCFMICFSIWGILFWRDSRCDQDWFDQYKNGPRGKTWFEPTISRYVFTALAIITFCWWCFSC